MFRDTVVQVDLNKIAGNMDRICEMAGAEVAIMPVIKANGYGHGALAIAPTLMVHGAAYLAVATLTEALELRSLYQDYPIFILGHTPDRLLPYVVEKNITQMVFSKTQAEILGKTAKDTGTVVKVHLKVDTGFHRLGIDDTSELMQICETEGIETEGIFSHLALVNDLENQKQYEKFIKIIDVLERQGAQFKYKHIADSIAAVENAQYRMNMIRPGALIFGLKGYKRGDVAVKQALTFITKISQIHKISKGEGVGYDYLWKAEKDSVIGTLPFGYGDGYPRALREKGYVSIRGIKCPIIGAICMDQCMVDLSEVEDIKEGETVIIYGDGSCNSMSIAEAAILAGTNKNEIVARITERLPREYLI